MSNVKHDSPAINSGYLKESCCFPKVTTEHSRPPNLDYGQCKNVLKSGSWYMHIINSLLVIRIILINWNCMDTHGCYYYQNVKLKNKMVAHTVTFTCRLTLDYNFM